MLRRTAGFMAHVLTTGLSDLGLAQERPQTNTNRFNPAISAILDGRYVGFARDPADCALAGFQLGDEAGLSEEGLVLGEIEVSMSANIGDLPTGPLIVCCLALCCRVAHMLFRSPKSGVEPVR